MKIDLNKDVFDKTAKLALKLESKDQLRLILKLLPTLDSSQIEKLLTVGEQILTDIILKEDKALEEQVKFEYKEIKGSFYAYLRQLGQERRNDYLGPMRFMQGFKYKLTNKFSKAVKTLCGLGLHPEEEKIYLKIEHLTPTHEIRSYLFYDASDKDFPRSPQMIIEKIFSKKQWDIECLGPIKENGTVQKTILVQRSQLSERVAISKPATLETLEQEKILKVNKSFPIAPNTQNLSTAVIKNNGLETHQLQKTQPAIQVRENFISQVIVCLDQWEALTQSLSSDLQWKLIHNNERYILCNSENEVVAEYNLSSKILTTPTAHGLLIWLQEAMLAVTNSEATEEQKTTANRWLTRLECAPKKDSRGLLAYLFCL